MILLLPGNVRAYGAVFDSLSGRDLSLLGWLLTPSRSCREHTGLLRQTTWAVDNGCFAQGEAFDFDRYLRFLGTLEAYPQETLRFITVPDVVAEARATAHRWAQYAPRLRETGLPLAYVAQDGLDALPDEDFQCLFIGGSTEYKLSQTAGRLIHAAQAAGKWVHVGRVNSRCRLRHFTNLGADSVDGTGWARNPSRDLRWALNELRCGRQQLSLPGVDYA